MILATGKARRRSRRLVKAVARNRTAAAELSSELASVASQTLGSAAGLSWSFSAGALVGETLDSKDRASHRFFSGLIRRGLAGWLLGKINA